MVSNSARTYFLNAAYDDVDFSGVCSIVDAFVSSDMSGYMVSLNVDACVKIDKNSDFRNAFFNADLILMDSQPLTMIARSNGLSVKEKLSGSDLMPRICSYAASNGYSCFILGGMPGVPERAAAALQEKNSDLIVAGTLSPDYGFEKDSAKLLSVIEAVREASPDILFVCMGMPKSEMLLDRYLEEMNARFAFSVGAAVDFEAGSAKRAPKWMQNAGLEWLYRFIREPKRLFKRYFLDSWRLLPIVIRNRKANRV